MKYPWRRLFFGRWSWKRPFYFLAFLYLALSTFGYFFADSLIFQPPKSSYSLAPPFLQIESPAGKQIAAYYREPSPGMPVILWSHGNAETLGTVQFILEDLHQRGYGALSYDYPGYGLTVGKPTEEGCYDAIIAAYQFLIETQQHHPKEIILLGHSVGSGPTCWLASKFEHAAVILISPFTSTFRVMTRFGILPFDRFPNLKRITKFDSPLLIIHGSRDRVIPHRHGKTLFDRSQSEEKTFLSIDDAGHNDLFSISSKEIFSAISQHVSQLPHLPSGKL